jgi:hypothetical protein
MFLVAGFPRTFIYHFHPTVAVGFFARESSGARSKIYALPDLEPTANQQAVRAMTLRCEPRPWPGALTQDSAPQARWEVPPACQAAGRRACPWGSTTRIFAALRFRTVLFLSRANWRHRYLCTCRERLLAGARREWHKLCVLSLRESEACDQRPLFSDRQVVVFSQRRNDP